MLDFSKIEAGRYTVESAASLVKAHGARPMGAASVLKGACDSTTWPATRSAADAVLSTRACRVPLRRVLLNLVSTITKKRGIPNRQPATASRGLRVGVS